MLTIDNTAETALSRPHNDSDGVSHLPCYSIPAPSRWACVYTHPQAERWANDNLTRIGYQTYLPLYLVSRPDRVTPSIVHRVLVPLFSRYLFVQFDHRAASWSPIREAPGVVDLIRCGSDVHYAQDATVSALQAGEELRRHPNRPQACFSPGSACVVTHGPCQGLEGTVLYVRRSIAHVALLMLGQLRTVAVDWHHLAPRPVP